MTSENTQNKNQTASLNDSELGEVTGGFITYHDSASDTYYVWQGDATDDSKYLCPNCKRPVHFGSWLRYYCDPCNASWLKEGRLLPNLNASLWKQVSEQEYRDVENSGPRVDIH